MEKPRPSSAQSGLGSLATGAVTALGIGVQTGLAAVVGVVIARELGRTAETDGFFAAYAVFIAFALAANALRVILLPRLARAREARRLSAETAAYAVAIAWVAVPALVVGIVAAGPIADVLTGSGPDDALDAAAAALPWMIVAGLGQFTAGLLASALAALDDYVVAAAGYVTGSIAGLVLIDTTTELLYDRLSKEEQAQFLELNASEPVVPDGEQLNFPALFAEMRAAKPAPRVPAAVLVQDEGFGDSEFERKLFRAHEAAQQELAKMLRAKLGTETDSGHYIFVEHPELVTKEIRRVVNEARESQG